MAKVTLAPAFESLSGKLCNRTGQYVALNSKTGKMYLASRHSNGMQNTEAQQAQKEAFKTRSTAAATWWNTHKAANDDAYKAVITAYNAQNKIGNPYSFFLANYDKFATDSSSSGSGSGSTGGSIDGGGAVE